jgi:hypothetical protein
MLVFWKLVRPLQIGEDNMWRTLFVLVALAVICVFAIVCIDYLLPDINGKSQDLWRLILIILCGVDIVLLWLTAMVGLVIDAEEYHRQRKGGTS